jgi:hypothetical protein
MNDAQQVSGPSRRFHLTIAAIFRDEAPYLAEWIEYHILLGVEHLYLYDNGSSDGPLDVLRPYILQGRATLLAWPAFPGQDAAYNHALKIFGRDSDWMLLIDVDEYLRPPPGRTIADVLTSLGPGVDQLLLPWVHFGGSGHEVRPPGLVIENYVHRVADAHRQPKALVRPEAVAWAEVHHCITRAGRTTDPSGRALPEAWLLDDPPRGDMCIAHYFTKSREEFAAKLARGQADGGRGKTMADYHRFDTPVEDRSVAALGPSVRDALRDTARHTPGHVFAALSAASELAPSRVWLLAVRAALARTQQALGLPAGRVTVSADSAALTSASVPPAAASAAFDAVGDAIGAVPVAMIAAQDGLVVAEAAPLGRPFVAWRSSGASGTVTITVHGHDAGGKRWSGSTGIAVQDDGTLAFAILSQRTIVVHAIVVDVPPGLKGVVGAVFSFV